MNQSATTPYALLASLVFLTISAASWALSEEAAVAIPDGINAEFKNPDLNVDEWIGRFEVESREVFAARDEVIAACELKAGEQVADVGAGTGFYSQLFAKGVGPAGRVFSVDIAPNFLEHIETRAQAMGALNITTVLCTEDSVCLAPESVDLVFICDTYHHFERHQRSLASIYRSLKPGGRLVLIDFERIPGVSREFILGHVRGGKEVFRSEIIEAGFQLRDEVQVEGFEENYLLRFTRLNH